MPNLLFIPTSFEAPQKEVTPFNHQIFNIVTLDYNNDKIKLNGIPAKQSPLAPAFLSFLYIYYNTSKTKEKLGKLILEILQNNIPELYLIEVEAISISN